MQRGAIDALEAAKQSSAADAIEDSAWTMVDGEVRVETELSPVMLPIVINADAEKIIRAAVRDCGVLRMKFLPGTASASAPKKQSAPRTGSVQAKAAEHPMVQQAQKLFQAEIQTVIDLRDGK
jgi:DNA polymerase III subunit gamma/tau